MEFLLSAGNDHDSIHAVKLLERIEISGSSVLTDRAYGAKKIRAYISERGSSYAISPQGNVSKSWPVDCWRYKERHLIEYFFQKLKWFRRVATRYDKLNASFLAFVYLVSISFLQIIPCSAYGYTSHKIFIDYTQAQSADMPLQMLLLGLDGLVPGALQLVLQFGQAPSLDVFRKCRSVFFRKLPKNHFVRNLVFLTGVVPGKQD